MTPKRWLDRREIEDAFPRLRKGQRIKEMFSKLGSADPSHFARVFRRITGMAPRDARSQKLHRLLARFQIGLKSSKKARKVPKWPV